MWRTHTHTQKIRIIRLMFEIGLKSCFPFYLFIIFRSFSSSSYSSVHFSIFALSHFPFLFISSCFLFRIRFVMCAQCVCDTTNALCREKNIVTIGRTKWTKSKKKTKNEKNEANSKWNEMKRKHKFIPTYLIMFN